ncbi:D-tagatose-1,6-bisphosphate aldolase subunit KbaY [Raoultella terrigena]|uniref:D-tagatose-1,6-bisphosphate aldolase subunit KbaY n=1 Tax=Raoultella terrigena TaxID=577 RepID=A0A4U9CU99_RAOTE|nr:D-tagatose-1,6-bisphosphate aldolase subunit KbaY [Raoultella terrigena]
MQKADTARSSIPIPRRQNVLLLKLESTRLRWAIGTSHGLYPVGMQPKLDIERLQEIRQRLNIPLVLHGGSGNKDSEVAESIQFGVGKINISQRYEKGILCGAGEELKGNSHEPNALFLKPMAAAREVVAHKMRLFSSIGQSITYA